MSVVLFENITGYLEAMFITHILASYRRDTLAIGLLKDSSIGEIMRTIVVVSDIDLFNFERCFIGDKGKLISYSHRFAQPLRQF